MNAQTFDRPMRQPISQWESLSSGDKVEVWLTDAYQYVARVDQVGLQGQIIWVIENGTAHRRLFLREDGVTLCPV